MRRDKAELPIDGTTLLNRVLSAVSAAERRIVVGARPEGAAPLPSDVLHIVEEPLHAGPAYAVSQSVDELWDSTHTVVLAADLPFFTEEAFRILAASAGDQVAAFADENGRFQWLTSVWPNELLRERADRIEPNAPMRRLFQGLDLKPVPWPGLGTPPWADCDTPEEWREALRKLGQSGVDG